VPASSPVSTAVLATVLNSVLLPLLGRPTSAMRTGRPPRLTARFSGAAAVFAGLLMIGEV